MINFDQITTLKTKDKMTQSLTPQKIIEIFDYCLFKDQDNHSTRFSVFTRYGKIAFNVKRLNEFKKEIIQLKKTHSKPKNRLKEKRQIKISPNQLHLVLAYILITAYCELYTIECSEYK